MFFSSKQGFTIVFLSFINNSVQNKFELNINNNYDNNINRLTWFPYYLNESYVEFKKIRLLMDDNHRIQKDICSRNHRDVIPKKVLLECKYKHNSRGIRQRSINRRSFWQILADRLEYARSNQEGCWKCLHVAKSPMELMQWGIFFFSQIEVGYFNVIMEIFALILNALS